MNAFAHLQVLYALSCILSRGYVKVSTLFAGITQKSFKKGLTKFFCGCIMQSVKAKASLSVSAQRRYFLSEIQKQFYIMKKAKTSLML